MTNRPADITDPVERVIGDALHRAGIIFDFGPANKLNLDFYLPAQDIHIEACQFYTPRKIEQCSRTPNIILIQGLVAARAFADMINGGSNDGHA